LRSSALRAMTDRFYPPIGTAGGDAVGVHAGPAYELRMQKDKERKDERKRLGQSLSAQGFTPLPYEDPRDPGSPAKVNTELGPTARGLGMDSQLRWHRTYWDEVTNKYRSSTRDMMQGKEVVVKNDYPCGYQGNAPSVKFDMLYRNTQFDVVQKEREMDPMRNAYPISEYHKVKTRMDPIYSKDEVPDTCPTLKTIPQVEGPLGGPALMKAPWGMFGPNYNALGPTRPRLTFRLSQSQPVLDRTVALSKQRKEERGFYPRKPGTVRT